MRMIRCIDIHYPIVYFQKKAQHFEEYGIYEENFKEILDELESDYGVHDFHTTGFDGDFMNLRDILHTKSQKTNIWNF